MPASARNPQNKSKLKSWLKQSGKMYPAALWVALDGSWSTFIPWGCHTAHWCGHPAARRNYPSQLDTCCCCDSAVQLCINSFSSQKLFSGLTLGCAEHNCWVRNSLFYGLLICDIPGPDTCWYLGKLLEMTFSRLHVIGGQCSQKDLQCVIRLLAHFPTTTAALLQAAIVTSFRYMLLF